MAYLFAMYTHSFLVHCCQFRPILTDVTSDGGAVTGEIRYNKINLSFHVLTNVTPGAVTDNKKVKITYCFMY